MTLSLRDWLLLARISNLPTIATNVLASGIIAGRGRFEWSSWVTLTAAMSAIYVAGMILNDACDLEHDRQFQPNRPLVTGRVTLGAARAAVVALMVLGVWLVWSVSVDRGGPIGAVVLAAAVALYDLRHKQNPWAPLLMGGCRGLVWVVVALAVTGRVAPVVLGAAAVMVVYVTGLTVAARRLPAVRPNVPLLIAAISLVDGLLLAATGAWLMAAVALAAIPVTLALQRVIPGD